MTKSAKKKRQELDKNRKRAKKLRQQWWNNLTSEQQGKQIEKWQAQKAKRRKNEPSRILKFNPKYPWMTEGVNSKNKKQWLAMIHKKNPWLKIA